MKRLVIGNWKMHPATLEEAKVIIRKTRTVASTLLHTEVVICPPFIFIPAVTSAIASSKSETLRLKAGAQSVSYEEEGSHTGEVGAPMLRDLGVKYVIVGHSEQRAHGETDAQVARQVSAVIEVGMDVILCVGEHTRDEHGAYFDFLRDQIKNSLSGVPAHRVKNIILAYEPVWAIGATEAMNPEQIREMTLFVRKTFADLFSQDQAMKATVLYGGSVNFRNAAEIITIGTVDGLLVGRESVNMPGFSELLKAVDAVG